MILALVGETAVQEMIEEAARKADVEVLVLPGEEPFLAALQEAVPDAVFVDVGAFGLDGFEVVQKLKRNPATRVLPVVVFGNTLRADLMQDAREAGADLVLPKAAFREQLPDLLRRFKD